MNIWGTYGNNSCFETYFCHCYVGWLKIECLTWDWLFGQILDDDWSLDKPPYVLPFFTQCISQQNQVYYPGTHQGVSWCYWINENVVEMEWRVNLLLDSTWKKWFWSVLMMSRICNSYMFREVINLKKVIYRKVLGSCGCYLKAMMS